IFFFQAEDGIRDYKVTGVQTCALPISLIGWTIEAGSCLRTLWRGDWFSFLLPDALDFRVPTQDRFSTWPRKRRRHFCRVPPFIAPPGNFSVVRPSNRRDVPILHADVVQSFGGRTIKKRRCRR